MKDFIEYLGISVCVNDCDYKGFSVKESMLKINRQIVNECFYRFNDIEINIKEDAIVAGKINDTTYKLFIKPNDIWEEVLCYIPDEFAELQKKIDSLLDIQYWNFDKYIYKTGRLYTGPGFMLRDGDEDVYFVNYRKTDIDGLYEVSNWTNDEYSDDKTGFSHFEWVTKQDAESYINGESFVKELTRCSDRYSINFIKQMLN
jgi:hypothetical protein